MQSKSEDIGKRGDQVELRPGDRVEYVGDANWFGPDDSRLGTVVRLWQGFDDHCTDDGECVSSRPLPYPQDWAASVRVDARPVNWPYGERDKFAPDVADLRLVARGDPTPSA